MATFEENLTTIETTIYGTELRRAIAECFQSVLDALFQPSYNFYKIEERVTKLENERRN